MRVPALGAIGARFALIDGLADDVLKLDVGPVAHTHLDVHGRHVLARGGVGRAHPELLLLGSGLDDCAQDGVVVTVEVRLDDRQLLKPVQLALQDGQALELLLALLAKQLQTNRVRDLLVCLFILPDLVLRVFILIVVPLPVEVDLAFVGIVADVAEGVYVFIQRNIFLVHVLLLHFVSVRENVLNGISGSDSFVAIHICIQLILLHISTK